MEAAARTWYVNVMVALHSASQAAWTREGPSTSGATRHSTKHYRVPETFTESTNRRLSDTTANVLDGTGSRTDALTR